MKKVNAMPTVGQFVAVWENTSTNGGEVWADTYRWHEGELEQFSNTRYDWIPAKITLKSFSGKVMWFIVKRGHHDSTV